MTLRTQATLLALGLLTLLSAACGNGRAPNANIGDPVNVTDAGADDAGTEDAGITSCQVKYDCPPGEICFRSQCRRPSASCRTDADCPTGQICGTDSTCAPGCSDQRDCLEPLLCDPVRATCDVCSRSNPCPTGETCLAGSCRPMTECQTTADCLSTNDGEICINGSCSPCTTDADCNVAPYNTQGRHCDRSICSLPASDGGMTGCHSKYECPAGQVCRSQQCEPPPTGCGSNADCPVGRVCGSAGTCQPGCADVRDCAPNQICNTATNTCQTSNGCNVQSCSQQCAMQNLQCDPTSCQCINSTCDINNCVQQCAQQGEQCNQMTCGCAQMCDVASCNQRCSSQGLQCDTNTCGCTGTGGTCMQNTDCPMQDVCSSGTCAEQATNGSGGSCDLISCLLGSFGVGSPCVGATTGQACNCQSAFSGLGSGGLNFQGPFACQ